MCQSLELHISANKIVQGRVNVFTDIYLFIYLFNYLCIEIATLLQKKQNIFVREILMLLYIPH